VEEQGVDEALELDEHDREDRGAVHAVALDGELAVGAGRFYENGDGSVQIGRMAVLASHRGRGVGPALLIALIDEARRRGFQEARLDAQLPARDLYLREGFTDDGARLWDAGILHQPMKLRL